LMASAAKYPAVPPPMTPTDRGKTFELCTATN